MPYKDIEKRRKAFRDYYKKYIEKERLRSIEKNKIRKAREPWKFIFIDIKRRCTNIKRKDYKYYGGKGIKCLITSQEIKELWFRDKAYLMKQPSIDRKDNNGHYEFNNCRFIEMSKNIGKRNQEYKNFRGI